MERNAVICSEGGRKGAPPPPRRDTYYWPDAVAYAREYGEEENPDYPYYAGDGGDCTNFISQCIKAGGIEEGYDWNCKRRPFPWRLLALINSDKAWDPTRYWTSAPDSFTFTTVLLGNRFIAIDCIDEVTNSIASYGIRPGDLMYFENATGIHHAAIITDIQNGEIKYTQHSYDDVDIPFKSFKGSDFRVYIVLMGGR